MDMNHFEFGLDSFVVPSLDENGVEQTGDITIRNTVEEAVLADEVGIDTNPRGNFGGAPAGCFLR